MKNNLPDIQENSKPKIKIFINHVGIENVKIPTLFIESYDDLKLRSFITLSEASISINIDLDCNTRATSLSRFMSYLSEFINEPIIIPSNNILKLLEHFQKISKNKSNTSNIKFDFNYIIDKKSIISNNSFPQFYKCFLQFELIGNNFNIYQGLQIPYFSVCPCSQSLCVDKGVPHSQRCKANLILHTKKIENFSYLIEEFENIVVNKMYPIIKRIDEREMAIISSENAFFVEDIIRKIINKLNSMNVKDWIVKCTHEDSIHQHDVIAIAYKGIDNGFNKYTRI